MNERQTAIIEYVSTNGKTTVNRLAEYCKISQVTIRKDLDYLSSKGILNRERGFAMLNDPSDINYRLAFHYEDKLRMAEAALSYVEDGETLIIESGSTCAIFAELVAKTKSHITIITNSMHIATFIKDYPNINIILLGGILQPQTQALVGPITKEAIKNLHVDKIFVGADGYSRSLGFTGDDLIRSETLKSMIAAANKTFVLTESSKFERTSPVSFLPFESVYQIITDDKIPQEELDFLATQDIKVTLV